MTTIYLIRHGETDWNAIGKLQGRTDIPLNNRGISQAQECRDFLVQFEWDLIITSPLKRAKRTAEIINEGLQVPLIVMEEVQEKYFGEAEGMTAEERHSAFPDRNYTNQEENEEFHKRIMSGLTKINELYKDSRVVLVAHGAVIHALLTIISGEENNERKPLRNACINHLQYELDQWIVKEYNQVTHLSEFNRN